MVYDSDESDSEYENIWQIILVRRMKKIRERPDYFNQYDDVDFRDRFRVSKEAAWCIYNYIKDHIKNETRNNALGSLKMFLLTLRFYATGGFQQTVGDIFGVSKSTASRAITTVTHHIALVRKTFIVFDNSETNIAALQKAFYKTAKFPRVIAAMDCTHVKISSPGGNDAELFRNRKGFFSINVQTLCDSQLKILNIVARWPGSSHDSRIFKNSRIHSLLESNNFKNGIVVGDSGYENTNIVLTPLLTPRTSAESLYNESHIRTRNCVERSYGVWKRRFPILAMGIRMQLRKVPAIIVATAILHNICCNYKDYDAPPVSSEEEEAIYNSLYVNALPFTNNSTHSAGGKNKTRKMLIDTHFCTL